MSVKAHSNRNLSGSEVAVCSRCVLPGTFPRVRFDEDGVCNFCRDFVANDGGEAAKARFRTRFEELVERLGDRGEYDVLVCYSGGKDSTFTLQLLREEYRLNVLAVTIDNGFVSPGAVENIRKVVESLDVDHIFFKPRFGLLRRAFAATLRHNPYSRKSLERASPVCTTCMSVVKAVALKMAIANRVPFIAYGWSPGQAPISASLFRFNAPMVRTMQQQVRRALHRVVGPEIDGYFLKDWQLSDAEEFPYQVSPLGFLDYDERTILEKIAALGWEAPRDTDSCSTNCLLNALASEVHKDVWGFHPYAFEVAGLVRRGVMDRQEGLARLEARPQDRVLRQVCRRLRIECDSVTGPDRRVALPEGELT